MSKKPSALVIGVGAHAGLGAALCRKFATEGYHVFAAGRTQTRLDAVVESITEARGSAEAAVVDATSEESVVTLFARAMSGNTAEPASLIVYNAGKQCARGSRRHDGRILRKGLACDLLRRVFGCARSNTMPALEGSRNGNLHRGNGLDSIATALYGIRQRQSCTTSGSAIDGT